MGQALDDGVLSGWAERGEPDAHIAELAKADSSAFGELYERYYPRVYRYVYHRVGLAADAEDLTAVIFMKALEGLASYESCREFSPWLFRIARNAVVDHYRRQRPSFPLERATGQASDDDPAGSALRREQHRQLRGLLEQLSDEQQEVVLLRYAADLSHAEIAAALHKNQAAVRMLLHRGLRKLKAVLDNDTF